MEQAKVTAITKGIPRRPRYEAIMMEMIRRKEERYEK